MSTIGKSTDDGKMVVASALDSAGPKQIDYEDFQWQIHKMEKLGGVGVEGGGMGSWLLKEIIQI